MIAALLLSFFVLTWLRPRLGAGFVLALLPSYLIRFSFFGIPVTLLEGMMVIVVVVALLRGGTQRDGIATSPRVALGDAMGIPSPFRDPLIVFGVLWIVIGTLAALASPAYPQQWGIWKAYIVEPVLFAWALRVLISSKNIVRDTLVPLAVGAFGVAAFAVWQHWTGYGIPFPWFDPEVRRVTSVFGYPNAVGLYLAPLVVLFFAAAASTGASSSHGTTARGSSMMLAMTALLSLPAIFFTRSVGAMIAVIVGMIAWAKLHVLHRWFTRHARLFAILLVAGWVAGSLVLTAWLPNQPERPRDGSELWQKLSFQQWSGSVRLSQYRETWDLLREHPFQGGGLANYPNAIRPYHEKSDVEIFQYPHNFLLAVWSELGLAGVGILLILLAILFHRAFSSPSPIRTAVAAAMIVLLVYGLVDVPMMKNDLAVLWWVFIALGFHAPVTFEQSSRS
jgi:O-antigen ligase